ncbi:hypothetical protein TIFTF001_019182 [Ficus carica]|uniref:Coatomer subunit zeta n=1 Tax=Ficus carica TaxID=3494 RepID=A0AA88AB65_FICCA|nr:hypothetical protein TIFTF001_019182 [Ficus carica]
MILAVLFANSEGNILVERFNGVPAEERLHWRSFLVKLGADNLKGVKNEELLVACHKSVYVVYTVLGDVSIYVVGKDEYDELALSEVILVITSAVKDVCGKPPSERLFLDKYGKICLCLDEIVWKVSSMRFGFYLLGMGFPRQANLGSKVSDVKRFPPPLWSSGEYGKRQNQKTDKAKTSVGVLIKSLSFSTNLLEDILGLKTEVEIALAFMQLRRD